jgi:hypothetical protein
LEILGGEMEVAIRKSPLATMAQAAAYLQVCERSLSNYQKMGWVDVRYIGKRRFFTWASLEKLARTGAQLAEGR